MGAVTADANLTDIVVEWAAGEPERFEWDEASGGMRSAGVQPRHPPPEHYGCIPGALCAGDGELLDVLLLRDHVPRRPGDRVKARVIGVLRRGDGDHKLLAVDPAHSSLTDVSQVPAERLGGMWRWFWRRQVLLGWFGPDAAREVLEESRRAWRARNA